MEETLDFNSTNIFSANALLSTLCRSREILIQCFIYLNRLFWNRYLNCKYTNLSKTAFLSATVLYVILPLSSILHLTLRIDIFKNRSERLRKQPYLICQRAGDKGDSFGIWVRLLGVFCTLYLLMQSYKTSNET